MIWTLGRSFAARAAFFAALYFVQGVSMGLTNIALPAKLASDGRSVAEIAALISWSTLPWTFKWAVAPIMDRWSGSTMGRRRPWILFAQVGMLVTIVLAAALRDGAEQIPALTTLLFVHNIFAALQDVSVDALAVEVVAANEQGRMNGIMAGAKTAGMSAGGALLGLAIVHSGVQSALSWEACVLLGACAIPLLVREPPTVRTGHEPSPGIGVVFRLLLQSVFRKDYRPFLLVALATLLYKGAFDTSAPVHLIQTCGWEPEEYSSLVGGAGVVLSLLGSLLGGLLADRLGAPLVYGIAMLLIAPVLVGLGAQSADSSPSIALLLLSAFCFIDGCLVVCFFALAMQTSKGDVAACRFTAYMSFANLSFAAGSLASGWHGVYLSSGTCLAVAGVLALLPLLPLRFLTTRPVAPADAR